MRTTTINRKTAETDIALTLNLDGTGASSVSTDTLNTPVRTIISWV